MEYEIHGIAVEYNAECGIYMARKHHQKMEYRKLNLKIIEIGVNSIDISKAIEEMTRLRDLASDQASSEHTPINCGLTIVTAHPEPSVSIDEVRDNIRNTERFCDAVLQALKGG